MLEQDDVEDFDFGGGVGLYKGSYSWYLFDTDYDVSTVGSMKIDTMKGNQQCKKPYHDFGLPGTIY